MPSIFQPFPIPAGRRAHAWRYQPAYRRPRHFHEDSEINLITRGTGLILLGDREIEVGAGSLVWFPPGLDHYLAAASADFELLTAGFRPGLLDAFTREHALTPSFARPWQRLQDTDYRQLANIMDQANATVDNCNAEQRLLDVLRTLVRLSSSSVDPLGHRAASFVLTHPTASRDRLARAMRSNRGDVSRQFHRDHGTTLRHYRNTLRTLEFLRLSEEGATNLTRAALEAGFGSYSQCHRVFRSLLGVSPREFLTTGTLALMIDRFEPLDE